MRGTSGPELVERMVERQSALQVIYMSGYTHETIVQQGVLKPVIAFLHKPFTADTLERKLREVLDGIGVQTLRRRAKTARSRRTAYRFLADCAARCRARKRRHRAQSTSSNTTPLAGLTR
jgi:DNA-binding NtrC family response regulator